MKEYSKSKLSPLQSKDIMFDIECLSDDSDFPEVNRDILRANSSASLIPKASKMLKDKQEKIFSEIASIFSKYGINLISHTKSEPDTVD